MAFSVGYAQDSWLQTLSVLPYIVPPQRAFKLLHCLRETHIPSKCQICSEFNSRSKKFREVTLKLLLMESLGQSCPGALQYPQTFKEETPLLRMGQETGKVTPTVCISGDLTSSSIPLRLPFLPVLQHQPRSRVLRRDLEQYHLQHRTQCL